MSTAQDYAKNATEIVLWEYKAKSAYLIYHKRFNQIVYIITIFQQYKLFVLILYVRVTGQITLRQTFIAHH